MSLFCVSPGCLRDATCRDFCNIHYQRALKDGTLEAQFVDRHGHFKGRQATTTYRSWLHMRGRCLTPTDVKYPDYGGRGITICPRWDVFSAFLEDMGEKPEGLTLGRKDNDGHYNKENCEWQTPKEQANNRRPKRLQKNSGSGLIGVSYTSTRNTWVASFYPEGKTQVVLYRGKDFFEACCARKSWEARQSKPA